MAGKGVRAETLRLVALPLARKPHLTYYYADKKKWQPPPPPKPQFLDQDGKPKAGAPQMDASAAGGAGAGGARAGEQGFLLRWMNKGTDFGARQWDALGKAPKGNWKWRIYMTGERMMDRIPFEEWALKSIDPALAPKPLRTLLEKEKGKAKADPAAKVDPLAGLGNDWAHADADQVPFVYPASLEQPDALVRSFRTSLAQREPYHRKWMKLNLYLSPLTLPFALIPVIPNLPFFYMLWRAWSHWRALKASEYLNLLLARGLVMPQASKALDNVYKTSPPPSLTTEPDAPSASTTSSTPRRPTESAPSADEPSPLLSKEMVPKIIDALKLGEEAKAELNRAIDQAKARLRNLESTRTESKAQTASTPEGGQDAKR